MIISVGGRDFVPFKCAGEYLGGFSATWLKQNFPNYGAPKRVYLSPKRTGYWRSDLDKWLRKRKRRAA